MRLFNAHQPSWLGHAMEPVLNNGLPAFPIRRADTAYNAMSHRACYIFKNLGASSQCAGLAVDQFVEMLSRH